MHRLFRWPLRFLAGLISLVLAYALGILVFGLLPMHSQWRNAASSGITIWVTTNGVHSALLLPRKTPQIDWSTLFPPTDTADPQLSGRYDMVELGWGDRRFYLEVPNWSDLRAGTAIRALTGMDGTALHIEYTGAPQPGAPDAVALSLTPEAYARLVARLRQSIRINAQGQAILIAVHHYDANDAFYEATGHYSLFMTCNEWVRGALSDAGVRTPWWSPLDKPLFWQLRRVDRTPRETNGSQTMAN
jgi:uncharacterized protein (TIGR02117 family)